VGRKVPHCGVLLRPVARTRQSAFRSQIGLMKGTARKFLLHSLRKRRRHFGRAREQCLDHCSPSSVHELRSECRRLVTFLDFCAVVVSKSAIERARHALKKILHASGPLRDAQLQSAWWKSHFSKAAKKIRRSLRDDERHHAHKLERTLRRHKFHYRLKACERELADECRTARNDSSVFPSFSRLLHRRYTDFLRFQRHAGADPRRLHRARVALRKFRMAAEALESVTSLPPAHELARLRRWQSLAGDIHDLDLMLRRVKTETGWAISSAKLRQQRVRLLRALQRIPVQRRSAGRGKKWW
jgi:CHAD domain-containing protein